MIQKFLLAMLFSIALLSGSISMSFADSFSQQTIVGTNDHTQNYVNKNQMYIQNIFFTVLNSADLGDQSLNYVVVTLLASTIISVIIIGSFLVYRKKKEHKPANEIILQIFILGVFSTNFVGFIGMLSPMNGPGLIYGVILSSFLYYFISLLTLSMSLQGIISESFWTTLIQTYSIPNLLNYAMILSLISIPIAIKFSKGIILPRRIMYVFLILIQVCTIMAYFTCTKGGVFPCISLY